ncbi:hypothetical protein ACS0TY_029780 [Phlomoides rotata]
MRALFFLPILAFVFSSAQSRSLIPRPMHLSSLKINKTQNAGTCSFSVTIRTSCYSTRYTRDHISLSFGDAYGNQEIDEIAFSPPTPPHTKKEVEPFLVYAPRLDDPRSRTFERCSTDTFQLYGPCTYQICYLYLYRSGYDGWLPYDVTVQGYNANPVTFYYNVAMPRDIWYGFDYCFGYRAASSASK